MKATFQEVLKSSRNSQKLYMFDMFTLLGVESH